MKRQLGVLLLIFIATVGLSSAASAAPIAQTTQAPTTYNPTGHGLFLGPWHVSKIIMVRVPPPLGTTLSRLRIIYQPPMHMITVKPLGFGRYQITVWDRSFIPGPRPVPLMR